MDFSQFIKLGSSAVAGFAAAFALASALLMSPADMVRWVEQEDSIDQRLSRVFDEAGTFQTERAQALRAENSASKCNLELTQLRSDNAELLSAASAHDAEYESLKRELHDANSTIGLMRSRINLATYSKLPTMRTDSKPSCLTVKSVVRGIHVLQGQTTRQIGNRLYISVATVSAAASECTYKISSDANESGMEYSFADVGQRTTQQTSIGSFEVVLSRTSGPFEKTAYCEFDLLKAQ